MEDAAPPIQIMPGTDGRLIVRLPYTAERVAKIKTIEGRRWHGPERYWTVPRSPDMPDRLRTLFAGDDVQVAPELHSGPAGAPQARASGDDIIARLREAVRARHLSPRTAESYASWVRRFIHETGRRPEELGEAEIGRFLSGLATARHVSASTQNQALHALLFLYTQVLGKKIARVEGVIRAKRPERLPVVLSRDEVRAVLGRMTGAPRLMAWHPGRRIPAWLRLGGGSNRLGALRARLLQLKYGVPP